MNSKAHSETPLKRVQELFFFFSSTLYGFELLASEFIPRWTSNEAEELSGGRVLAPPSFANSILGVWDQRVGDRT
jgi:hypothetical protein